MRRMTHVWGDFETESGDRIQNPEVGIQNAAVNDIA
jgi:hypothetical protein